MHIIASVNSALSLGIAALVLPSLFLTIPVVHIIICKKAVSVVKIKLYAGGVFLFKLLVNKEHI